MPVMKVESELLGEETVKKGLTFPFIKKFSVFIFYLGLVGFLEQVLHFHISHRSKSWKKKKKYFKYIYLEYKKLSLYENYNSID